MRSLPLVLASLFVVSGCASYLKRKSCEKANWYDHGYQVAMAGKRLTADGQYNECVKVEAEISHTDADVGWKAGFKMYCSVDGAYQKGQKGKKYNFSFCDASGKSKTRSAYKKGIGEFCQVKKARSFGASGGIYEKVCPAKVETKWLPEYNKGRVVYLKGEVINKRRNISEIDNEIHDLEGERRDLMYKINSLPRNQVMKKKRQYNPDTKTYTEVTELVENEDTKRERDSLNWDMEQLSRKIKSNRKRQSSIRKEIRDMEREIVSLQ